MYSFLSSESSRDGDVNERPELGSAKAGLSGRIWVGPAVELRSACTRAHPERDVEFLPFRRFVVVANDAAKGPASYFPSIEKKYGKPIAEW